MMTCMLSFCREKIQVAWVVVRLVSINMMYFFGFKNWSTNHRFHNKLMFRNICTPSPWMFWKMEQHISRPYLNDSTLPSRIFISSISSHKRFRDFLFHGLWARNSSLNLAKFISHTLGFWSAKRPNFGTFMRTIFSNSIFILEGLSTDLAYIFHKPIILQITGVCK